MPDTELQSWKELKIVPTWPIERKDQARRLNALGSLFLFEYDILGYTRLTRHLHEKHICRQLECERLRTVIEFPRDHFKTTCSTIGASMWWALPFTEADEKAMRELGYGDSWIRWMKRAHNTCTRTLIASEVRTSARKFGDKIAWHYESNIGFKRIFSEIIPKKSDRWGQDSRIHNRLNDGTYQSEGTYDFIGADCSLQSNHYERIIEDDIVGEAAVASDTVMLGTIDWHSKLPGCFDAIPGHPDDLGDQLIIGNRWSMKDLNAHVRKKEPDYKILMHSAEGGCCPDHPAGQPIFPEEFSMKKLANIRQIEGDYNYSCHFLNNPTAPGATRFKEKWIRWYDRGIWEIGKLTPQNTVNYWQLSSTMRGKTIEQIDAESGAVPRGLRLAMHHEAHEGEVLDDVRAADLDRVMIIDPLHAGDYGRTRNAILVLGIYSVGGQPRRVYFLDGWAKESSHEEWIDKAIGERSQAMGLAWKWKIHRMYGDFEEESGWNHQLKEKLKLRRSDNRFVLHNLKMERSENAKVQRIIGMESVYQSGAWWMPRFGDGAPLFMEEYSHFPHGATMDLLDLAGYSPQTFGLGSRAQARSWIAVEQRKRQELIRGIGRAGY